MSFWRLPVALLIACLLLIIAAQGIGHGLPPPTIRSALAENPCALPCFFGVTPGVTTYDQAAQIVPRYVQTSQINGSVIGFPLYDSSGAMSIATINFADERVVSARIIGVDLDANVGQLSDLLLSGQKPTHLFRTCDYVTPVRFLMTFGAHDEVLAELFPPGDPTPDTPLTVFDLTTAANRSLYDARSSFGCTTDTGWIGFAPLWKYFSLKPLD